jgi:hypothetical protein
MIHAESRSPTDADEYDLEAVLLELALEFADFTGQGFEAAVQTAAEQVNASVLFNVRFDHPRCQRVAAVKMAVQGKIYLLLLDRPGHKVSVIAVDEDHWRIIEDVIAWTAQPLPMQAGVDSQTQLKLLLYAACAPLRADERNEENR